MKKRIANMLGLAVLLTAIAAIPTTLRGADDIVTTAVKAGSFKTLAAAVKAAGLVEVLQSKGPFTVFAPTDAAFAKLPKGTVESLIKPENKAKLIAILKYHVVAGEVPASAVVKLRGAKTLNGQRADIMVKDGTVSVDKAKVVKADIRCSNGIIHVIDSVILPAGDNIPTTAAKAGSFKTLLAAAKAAGLAQPLSGKGPFTVFAPTDEAFSKLPKGTVETLLKPENRSKLAAILKYHVVKGRVYSEDAVQAKQAKTLQGQSIRISVTNGKARINTANLVATDIDASNGVIHVIDAILLPSEKQVSASQARQMIRHAVAKGAPLFNRGHAAECAAVYMRTMRKMVKHGNDLPKGVITSMTSTLTKAEHTHCPIERSWTLRHGLDHAFFAMRRLQ